MSGEDSYQVIKHGTIILHKTCRCFPQKRKKWSPWVHVPLSQNPMTWIQWCILNNTEHGYKNNMAYVIRDKKKGDLGNGSEDRALAVKVRGLESPWPTKKLGSTVIPALWRQTFGIREPLARTGELCVWREVLPCRIESEEEDAWCQLLGLGSGSWFWFLGAWLFPLKRLGLLESWCVLHLWYTWDTMNLGPPCVTLLDFPPDDFIPFYDGFLLTLSHFPLWELHIRSCTS